jgi:hypothetical protein
VDIQYAGAYNTVIMLADSIPKEISDKGFDVDTLVLFTNISISRLAVLARKKQKRMWIKRVDQEIVVCICDDIKKSTDINQEGWTPASETPLVYEPGGAGGAAKAGGAGGAGGADVYQITLKVGNLTFRMTLAKPSEATKSIRRAGIQAAVDYTSAVRGSSNSSEKAKMCIAKTQRKSNNTTVMSPIQELVYLTVGASRDQNERAVRIYAFAPGSGKSKAMAIALLDAVKNSGNGGKTCLVLNENSAYENLVLEIMSAMVDSNGNHVIDLQREITESSESITSSVSLTPLEHDKWDDELSVLLTLSGLTAAQQRQEVFEKTITMLKAAGIHVVYISKMGEADIIASCSCMVADECHEILSVIHRATECNRFYGFSATPFNKKDDIKSLMSWKNKDRKPYDDSELTSFVQKHVCFADGGDVRALLPYANLRYDTMRATCSETLTTAQTVYDVAITKEGRDNTGSEYKDINADLDESEYTAAVKEMARTMGESTFTDTRIFIYLQTREMLEFAASRIEGCFGVNG